MTPARYNVADNCEGALLVFVILRFVVSTVDDGYQLTTHNGTNSLDGIAHYDCLTLAHQWCHFTLQYFCMSSCTLLTSLHLFNLLTKLATDLSVVLLTSKATSSSID